MAGIDVVVQAKQGLIEAMRGLLENHAGYSFPEGSEGLGVLPEPVRIEGNTEGQLVEIDSSQLLGGTKGLRVVNGEAGVEVRFADHPRSEMRFNRTVSLTPDSGDTEEHQTLTTYLSAVFERDGTGPFFSKYAEITTLAPHFRETLAGLTELNEPERTQAMSEAYSKLIHVHQTGPEEQPTAEMMQRELNDYFRAIEMNLSDVLGEGQH